MKKVYKVIGTTKTKSEAEVIANSARRKGYERVRITKRKDGYAIWAFK